MQYQGKYCLVKFMSGWYLCEVLQLKVPSVRMEFVHKQASGFGSLTDKSFERFSQLQYLELLDLCGAQVMPPACS